MTTQLDDDILQRYYDGELSPVEERTVRARVEADPGARARLAELSRLSELMRMAADDMGAGLDSASLFAGIQADIHKQEELGMGPRLEVVREEWTTHRRGTVLSLGAAVAVAAAAMLAVLLPARDANAPVAETTPATPAAELAEAAPPVHGSRVENVDFGANTGTVFEIESQGVSTAVVWISDDEGATP